MSKPVSKLVFSELPVLAVFVGTVSSSLDSSITSEPPVVVPV